jgi:molybdenum cofactor cytidylyltransferase
VAGIILAAGSSSRLGANKLLIELAGEPLVRRAARRALAAGLSPVIVVLGFEPEPVAAALAGLPVALVTNPRHADGMPSSLQAGLGAVPGDCGGALVLLPDMPLVAPPMLAEMIDRFRAANAPLVISLYGETAAPPTLYSRALFRLPLPARAWCAFATERAGSCGGQPGLVDVDVGGSGAAAGLMTASLRAPGGDGAARGAGDWTAPRRRSEGRRRIALLDEE